MREYQLIGIKIGEIILVKYKLNYQQNKPINLLSQPPDRADMC